MFNDAEVKSFVVVMNLWAAWGKSVYLVCGRCLRFMCLIARCSIKPRKVISIWRISCAVYLNLGKIVQLSNLCIASVTWEFSTPKFVETSWIRRKPIRQSEKAFQALQQKQQRKLGNFHLRWLKCRRATHKRGLNMLSCTSKTLITNLSMDRGCKRAAKTKTVKVGAW